MNRRIFIVGPSGSGKTTVGTAVATQLGLPLFSMDEFRAKGKKLFAEFDGKQVRNYEDPSCWDVNALGYKIKHAIVIEDRGFVCEGNHLLAYPELAAIPDTERYYLDVPHALSLSRRRTRNRGTGPDWSFAIIGEQQTALHVAPQKKLPGVVILDGTLPTAQTVEQIINAVRP